MLSVWGEGFQRGNSELKEVVTGVSRRVGRKWIDRRIEERDSNKGRGMETQRNI